MHFYAVPCFCFSASVPIIIVVVVVVAVPVTIVVVVILVVDLVRCLFCCHFIYMYIYKTHSLFFSSSVSLGLVQTRSLIVVLAVGIVIVVGFVVVVSALFFNFIVSVDAF